MDLYFREYGQATRKGETLVLLHGLLGSSVNWHSMARALAEVHHLLVPDLRNHGRSPHHPDIGYSAMAADVAALLDRRGVASPVLIGHSMGAKVAMWLALQEPQRIGRLVAVDMAPVTYPTRFGAIFSALESVDLGRIRARADAERTLQAQIERPQLRQYLLQNLEIRDSQARWRMNLKCLSAGIGDLLAFPDDAGARQYPGPSLFLYGGESDYVSAAHYPAIRAFFPHARLRVVPGAGHWVYADRPEDFLAALRGFLGAS